MSVTTRNNRSQLAASVKESLESGINPFLRPGMSQYPVSSHVSGREYAGINALYLQTEMAAKGYHCPEWITFSDAEKLGMSVRKGSKGVSLEHWEIKDEKPHCYSYRVFNLQQLAGENEAVKAAIESYQTAPIPDPQKTSRFLSSLGLEGISASNNTQMASSLDELGGGIAAAMAKQGFDIENDDRAMLRFLIVDASVRRALGASPILPDSYLSQRMGKCAAIIEKDEREMFSAFRDSNKVVKSLMHDFERTTERQGGLEDKDIDSKGVEASPPRGQEVNASAMREQAARAINEANRAEQILTPAAQVPRGNDANLRGVNLSGTDESVVASISSSKQAIGDMRADAGNTFADANAAERSAGCKFACAEAILSLDSESVSAFRLFPAADGQHKGTILSVSGEPQDRWAVLQVAANQGIILKVADISQEEALLSGEELQIVSRGEAIDSITELKSVVAEIRSGEERGEDFSEGRD